MNDIVEAGQRRDAATVPTLVDLLEDEDQGVRFYAILALERITGTRRGYDYAADEAERLESVRAWRRWLDEGGSSRAEPDRTAGPQSDMGVRASDSGRSDAPLSD